MESLLRMSGLLTEEEAGRTDLGTLEKRLAEKASATSKDTPINRTNSPAGVKSSTASMADGSPRPGSQPDSNNTPRDTIGSPSTEGDKTGQEVENLSEAMCSLVTNNIGETRYIGGWWNWHPSRTNALTNSRLIFGIFNILIQRYRVGK